MQTYVKFKFLYNFLQRALVLRNPPLPPGPDPASAKSLRGRTCELRGLCQDHPAGTDPGEAGVRGSQCLGHHRLHGRRLRRPLPPLRTGVLSVP